ncbi:hypothetical protein BGX29_008765 [Mortierella sp. GBA35]|nr:hypothetical protein BGX29_008765 [Mortierella sp. GBA35]
MAPKTPQGGSKTKSPSPGGPVPLTGIPAPASVLQRRSLVPPAASTTKAFQNMTPEQQSLLAEAISAHTPGLISANRRRAESVGSDSGAAGVSGTTNGASSPTGLASPLYVRSPQGRRPSTSRVGGNPGAFSAMSPLSTSALQHTFIASSSTSSPSTSSPTTPLRQSIGTNSGAASALSTLRLSKQPAFQRPTGTGPSGMVARNTTANTNGSLSTVPGSPAPSQLPASLEGIELGDRVVVESMGLTGYLRFVGPAHFKTGIWAGIELDTPTGKNDGTVAGVTYFTCRANCGIFVLAAKIVKTELLLPFSPTPTASTSTSAITQIPPVREHAQSTPPPQSVDHAAQAAARITAGSRASKYIGVTATQLKQRNVMPQPANSRLAAQQQQNTAAQDSLGSPSTSRTIPSTLNSPQTTSPTPSASTARSGLGSRLSQPGSKSQPTRPNTYSRSGQATSPPSSIANRPRTSPTPGRLMNSPRRLSSRSSDTSDTNNTNSNGINSVLPPNLLDQATLIQMAESPQGNLATQLQQLQLDFGVAIAENNMLKTEMNQTKSQLEMTRLLEKRDLSYDERVFLSKSLGRGGIDERLGQELEELHAMKEAWEKERSAKDQEIKSMTEKTTQVYLDAARWQKERTALVHEKTDLTEKLQELSQQQASAKGFGREEQQALIESVTKHLHDAEEKISILEVKLKEFQAQAVEDDAKVRTAEESLNASTAQWAEQLTRLEEERDALQARLDDLEVVLKVTTDSLRSKLEAALRDATHSEDQLHEVQARLEHEAEIRRTKETETESKLRQADTDLQESQVLLAKNEKLVKMLEERTKEYEASIAKREQEIAGLKKELEDLAGMAQTEDVDRMRKVWDHEKKRLEEAITEDITVIAELRAEIQILENSEDDLITKMTELEETVIELTESKEELESKMEQLQDQMIAAQHRFTQERSALESKVVKAEKGSEERMMEMKEKMEKLEAIASTVESWKGQCEAMQLEVIQKNAKIEDSGLELAEVQAQRDSFRQESTAVRKELEDKISQLSSEHSKELAAIQEEHNVTQGEKAQLIDKVSELEAALALAISTPAKAAAKSGGEQDTTEAPAASRSDLEEEVANLKLMVHDLTRENVTVGNVNKKLMQEHDNLMEAHKHVETECLKLMDEVERLHAESLATEGGSEAAEDKDELDLMESSEPNATIRASNESAKENATESLAAAAQSQSVIRLEGLLKEKQALLDRLTKAHASEMRDLRQRYVDLDRSKSYEVGQLNKELTELESLIESKIFHEADLEEEVQRKQKQIDRLQQEVSDLRRQLVQTPTAPSSSPYMSTSRSPSSRNYQPHEGRGSPLAAPPRSQPPKETAVMKDDYDNEVLFCEICEIEGHDIIGCKAVFSANKPGMRKLESSSSISCTPVPSEMEDDRPYCENCEEFGLHYTDECPNESLTRRSGDHLDDGDYYSDMTPMQELNRSSAAVPPLTSHPHPQPSSSAIFQNSTYGSESSITTTASDSADRGLLSATTDEKKKGSNSSDDAELGNNSNNNRSSCSSSDDDDGDDRSDESTSVDMKDEHGREVSPIAEVAAVVVNTDDPSIPCVTFRFWVMGLISIFSLSFFRDAPMVVGGLVIQLLSYPIGKFMATVLPTTEYNFFGNKLKLNPGPFNVKEHVLITIMASCGAGTAYAVDIIVIQRVFYKQDFGFLANLLLILTTQLVGYGMAGILRRYLVYPAAMIWPSNLATVALFNTLHRREELTHGQWTRQKFFAVCAIGSFLYYWIPAYIFPAITALTFLCYIQPSNVVLSQLTGSNGLGLGVLSLDWNTITAFLGSPLITPWWAQVNIMLGFILLTWVMVPTAYYLDIWDAKRFPILTSKLFTNEGYFYDTLSILTPSKTLDEDMYKAYGPLRIATFFAISYGVGFAGLTAILTHTLLYHRKQIWAQWKESRGASQDIHYKLMQAYKEVPEWWYLSLFCVTVALSIVTCEVWEYGLPWWSVILAVGLSALFSLPIGLIQAVTNQQPGLNILTEFIIGYILPGRPIANVTFKTYGYISMSHAMSFLGDLKLGQYMKIPPRTMFTTQLIGTFIAGFINLITANWLLETRPNICTPAGGHFTCLSANVFYSASVIWGVIAPERMFGPTSIYHPLMFFFIAGILIPIPFYLVSKRFPGTILDQIHIPILLTSTGMMPPARPFQYANWLVIGFIFQYGVRRHHNDWYQRFNYVLSAALDSGVAVSALVIFFTLQIHGVEFPKWWGTNKDQCPLDKANFYGQVPSNKLTTVTPVAQKL